MVARLLSMLLIVLASLNVEAFMSPTPRGSKIASSQRKMSSEENSKAPELKVVDPLEIASEALKPQEPVVSNMVKDMNTGEIKEVKWVDPAMSANTNPFAMNWWAYIAFGFPFVLLANDAFHFLPTDGPLGFLGRF